MGISIYLSDFPQFSPVFFILNPKHHQSPVFFQRPSFSELMVAVASPILLPVIHASWVAVAIATRSVIWFSGWQGDMRKVYHLHPGRWTAGTYSHHQFRNQNNLPNLHGLCSMWIFMGVSQMDDSGWYDLLIVREWGNGYSHHEECNFCWNSQGIRGLCRWNMYNLAMSELVLYTAWLSL